jgi:hypothetical protein
LFLIIAVVSLIALNREHSFNHQRLLEILRNPNQKKLLILTQSRSGSTFTSDIIGSRKKTYFVNEPLTFLEVQPNEKMKDVVVTYLENLFRCNIKFFLQQSAIGYANSPNQQDLYKRWKRLVLMGTAEDDCLPAELIVAKAVRARGESVWEWLLGRPDIKVR